MNSKHHLTLALIAAILTTGILLQGIYDQKVTWRKEIIRRNYREIRGVEANDSDLSTLVFIMRKSKTLEEVDKKIREYLGGVS